MHEVVMVPENAVAPLLGPTEARLNITYDGENTDLPDAIRYDATDQEILGWAAEALQNGTPGIPAKPNANLTDFVVDRFDSNEAIPYNRVMIRPKTPFGA